MDNIGTPEHPLRVAIIGSGPSGFYAAEALQKNKELTVEVDMFDRLPTPFGLVRGGVAPDHQKIKSVVKVYDRIASAETFRFFGNVEFGTDVTRADLLKYYHALIYAVGAQTDRNLGIPGEDLPGSHAATEFVAWYNGHPDYRNLEFDLSVESAIVVGVGNVAMDVARILARSPEELAKTDIADYALDALRESNIKNVYVLGRRGPVQAKFTPPEIKEFGEMELAEPIITPEDMELDEISQEYLMTAGDRDAEKNVERMREYAEREPEGKPRRVYFRFLVSPTEITGDGKVEHVKIVQNELYKTDSGGSRPRPTDKTEVIDAGLIFRSVGYRGVPLADVPFYDRWGTIPNDEGRVLTDQEDGDQVIGDYVVGWIKRGPSGVIGTNKPDSVATVASLVEDVAAGKVNMPQTPNADAVVDLLKERGIRYVTYADWQVLDAIETERGEAQGRPRVKFTSVEEMLDVLDAQTTGDKLPEPAGD